MSEKELFEQYKSDIYKTCLYMLRNVQDAEDMTQNVFLKVFSQNFNEVEKLKPWILSIAMNMCRNFMKRQKLAKLKEKLTFFEKDLSPANVESHVITSEIRTELQQQLDQLPDKIKSVIVLKYLHQLRNEEIASILKIPVGTVKSRAHKGLLLLKNSSCLSKIIYLEGIQ